MRLGAEGVAKPLHVLNFRGRKLLPFTFCVMPFGDNAARYLEARVEATNVFNHPSYGIPGQSVITDADPDSPTFGGINGKTGSRVMQIGLRLFF